MAKKKKKQKLPEGTPIEKYDYFSKGMEALQKHVIKVADELNKLREERADLETARDNMIHFYGNAVYQLIKVEREIRRAERLQIQERELGQDQLGPRVDMAPYEQLNREREGYVSMALDQYREVFRAEREVAKERLRRQKEAWDRRLDGEVALMKASHRVRSTEINKLGDAYTAAVLRADSEEKEAEERLLDMLEEEADKEFRRLVLAKNRQVHDMQRKNEQDVRGLTEAFSELKYSDLTIRFREVAVKLADECSILSNQLAEYQEFCGKHKLVKAMAEKHVKILEGLEADQRDIERSVVEKKKRYKDLVVSNYERMLEVGLIKDYAESDEEIVKKLWKDCISEVQRTRIKQLKIHHAMDTLRGILQKELEENLQLLNKHQGKVDNHIEELLNTYKKRQAMRNTITDLAERALREKGLSVEGLDLPKRYEVRQRAQQRVAQQAEAQRSGAQQAGAQQAGAQAERSFPLGRMVPGAPVGWDPAKFGLTVLPRQVSVR